MDSIQYERKGNLSMRHSQYRIAMDELNGTYEKPNRQLVITIAIVDVRLAYSNMLHLRT